MIQLACIADEIADTHPAAARRLREIAREMEGAMDELARLRGLMGVYEQGNVRLNGLLPSEVLQRLVPPGGAS